MAIPFPFPVAADDFLAYQEQLTGRKLNDGAREVITAWVPIINDAYTYGVDDDDRAMMDRLIEQHPTNSTVAAFLEKVKFWMEYATKQREEERGSTTSEY